MQKEEYISPLDVLQSVVPRSRGGISSIARELGISKQALHNFMTKNEGISLLNFLRIINACGFDLILVEGNTQGTYEIIGGFHNKD